MSPRDLQIPFSFQGLKDYVELFHADFRRMERVRWATHYLEGLLHEGHRKSATNLARRLEIIAEVDVSDPAQALQHFLNESPWDEQTVLRRLRRLLARHWESQRGDFVVCEVTFPKQGNHSVGVQRQYSREYQSKINCQLGIALHYVTPVSDFPVALRLYLPRAWLQSPHRLDVAGVPAEFRLPRTKEQIAQALFDEVHAEGLFHGANSEGPARSQTSGNEEDVRHRTIVARAEESWQLMKERLGLDHFEGRSWRGFHHHAALVLLAWGFLLHQEAEPSARLVSLSADAGVGYN